MRATIWPVLGTIAWYYAHDERQRGHGEVTLPPLFSRKERLGAARCTMRSPGANKDRLPLRLFALLSFQHKEKDHTPPLFVCTHARTHTHTHTYTRVHNAHAQRPTRRRFANACSFARGGERHGSGLPRTCENLPTFLVARANECTSEEFRRRGGEGKSEKESSW